MFPGCCAARSAAQLVRGPSNRLRVPALRSSVKDAAPRRGHETLPRKIPAPDVGADDVAEQLPLVALELHQLQLADRSEIVRAGVDLDARQQHFGTKVLQVRGLLHNI